MGGLGCWRRAGQGADSGDRALAEKSRLAAPQEPQSQRPWQREETPAAQLQPHEPEVLSANLGEEGAPRGPGVQLSHKPHHSLSLPCRAWPVALSDPPDLHGPSPESRVRTQGQSGAVGLGVCS